MNNNIIEALEACLQRMEHGESLDSVLADYPRLATRLRPLLMAAIRARAADRKPFAPTILARQRSRGLSLAEDLRLGKIRPNKYRRFFRPVVTVFLVIVILVMSSNGLLDASAHSIPGDTLYPLKRSVESTQLNLASDLSQRQVLEQIFSERRVEETKSLITIKRIADVDFSGVVTSKSGDEWLVSGIPVRITNQVDNDKRIEVGDDIDVHGSTDTTGTVDAIHLSLAKVSGEEEDHPGPTSTPTPSIQSPGESEFTATSTESTLIPAYSNGTGNQEEHLSSQQSTSSSEQHSSDESSHSSQTNSEDGGDH